jgi:hypothetical protein
MEAVELSVNAYVGDLPFLDQTYRHLSRQLSSAPLRRRRIVVDRRPASGRFSGEFSTTEFDRVLDRLLSDGVVDDIDEVDWSVAEVERIADKYFGDPNVVPVAEGGSAIHQYLWAIDTAQSELVLHFDSDMLLHDPNKGMWVSEAIAFQREHSHVAVTTPQGGPPRAESIRDLVFGSRRRVKTTGWERSEGVSTRVFLLDRERLCQALPLSPLIPGEPLERTLTASLHAAGFSRWNRNDDDAWAIHPRRHNRNHVDNLQGLISLVELGHCPYRRTGYRWDIRTEGRHFLPWRIALARERLRRRAPFLHAPAS